MLGWLSWLWSGNRQQRRAEASSARRKVRARYDAAQSTTGNAKHWGGADALGPIASNWSGTRWVLRNRARYEQENNSYCSGMVETLANDTVGTGPRPQVRSADPAFDAAVERRFKEWAGGVIPGQDETTQGIGLAAKLRLARQTRTVSGEVFLVFTTDADTKRPVKLDVVPLEPDHVETPYGGRSISPYVWEGVEYNEARKPIAYHIAKDHPGDGTIGGLVY
jgi:capsid protein